MFVFLFCLLYVPVTVKIGLLCYTGERLRQVFEGIDDPQWNGGDAVHPLCVRSERYEVMRKIGHPGEKIV